MSVSLWLGEGKALSSSKQRNFSNKFGFNRIEMKFQFKLICLTVLRIIPYSRKMRVGTPSFPSPKIQNVRYNCLDLKEKSVSVQLSKDKRISILSQSNSRRKKKRLRLGVSHRLTIRF